MALNLKNPEVEQLARALAAESGESLTVAVKVALQERLASLRARRAEGATYRRVAAIQQMVRELPVRTRRSDDEILGYDKQGLPK